MTTRSIVPLLHLVFVITSAFYWLPGGWAFVLNEPAKFHVSTLALCASKHDEASTTEAFCNLMTESLNTHIFTSFTLHGPKVTPDPTVVRGRLKRVQGRPIELKKKRQCLQVTFKFHGATDVAKNYDENEIVNTVIRPLLEGQSVVDSEWGPSVEGPIGTDQFESLQGARLETTTKQWEYQATYGKKQKLVSRVVKGKSSPSPKVLAHDRVKQRPLSPTDTVWSALGLTQSDGKPKPGKKAKLVQAQKFVEIVSQLLEKKSREQDDKVRVFDMGCGRGYLTFALHAHLMQDERKRLVETFGIDVRPKLVKDMNELSKSLDFKGLSFLQGTIEEYMVAGKEKNEHVEKEDDSLKVWLALHACDTATDDALWSGIVQEADIIVVAPCCHKELRPQLDRSMPLPDVLRHGIFRQRWAATLTDSIRVMLLEMAGYQVQVLEFVQTADTPQNVMITAVKKDGVNDVATTDAARQRLLALTKSHGVEHQALATWMGESLGENNSTPRRLGKHQMPAL
eukprot:scaffold14699_cov170-Amphora_coffeaeformis.AAC.12